MEALVRKKNGIEDKIKSIMYELDALGVGLKGKLVDEEGFPRNELDLYRIRELRNEHARLQTDHVALMKEIEAELPKYFANKK
jgi:26S proteasome regulatory subunit N4